MSVHFRVVGVALTIVLSHYYFATGRGMKYCDQCVCMFVHFSVCCLFVCLSVGESQNVYSSPKFLQFLSVAVARSPSDDSAIRYVLPVLWMTSCFHIMQGIGQNQRRRECFVQFARWRHQLDVTQRCLVKIASCRNRGEVCCLTDCILLCG